MQKWFAQAVYIIILLLSECEIIFFDFSQEQIICSTIDIFTITVISETIQNMWKIFFYIFDFHNG